MDNMKAKWNTLNTGTKVAIAGGGVIVGLLFVFKILPALIAAVGFAGLLMILIVPYWIPTIIAVRRKHESKMAIVFVNLFFGWTFVGWVLSLIWALSRAGSGAVATQTVIIHNNISTAGEVAK